jgi:PAS domain
MIGKPITTIITEDRHAEELEILGRLHRGERIDTFKTIRRRKDGSVFDISLTIPPVKDAGGRIIGASKIARDISDRKQAEAALRQNENFLRLQRDSLAPLRTMLDKFARGISSIFKVTAGALTGYRNSSPPAASAS